MKFLERLTLILYSYIVLIMAIIISLLIFNWIGLETIGNIVEQVITGDISSKITLGVCIIFILLSIKCIFFDDKSKQKLKESQGILLKNENGELMITRETIDSMVQNSVKGFESIKSCETRIIINNENQLIITLYIVVNENVIIKDLAVNVQDKIKEEVKNISDLEVKEINVKVTNLQPNKKNNE